MSEETKSQELRYSERLNIQTLTVDKVKLLIKRNIKNTLACWSKGKNIQKIAFHIIGPAGVGKTDICKQIATELTEETKESWKMIMIKSPVLSRDDFLIPFPVTSNGQTKFKMLYSDFVPIDETSCGLFIIDEFGRGDHNLQQLMWQIQNEFKIHLRDFPKKWFVISVDNPDDQEYSMDFLEDAAGLRRMLHICVEVSAPAFLKYAKVNGFHLAVTEFIETHNEYLYDFQAQKMGSVYANPASWEKVSDILWGYEMTDGIKGNNFSNLQEIDSMASGLLNISKTRMFIDFLKERKDINPQDVFRVYKNVRKEVLKLVNEKDNVRLGQLMSSFVTFLTVNKPGYGNPEMRNVTDFLLDTPIDTAAVFLSTIDALPRQSPDFLYLTKLHLAMMDKYLDYKKKFYEKMVEKSEQANSLIDKK
jgi:MoxR-like ATPase